MAIIDIAASQGWAMLPERAEELVSIVERENNPTIEVLEAYEAKYADRGERVRIRDGVAILDVQGPLFKKANLFVRISGATSYEILRKDFQVAVDDPNIHSIVLKVDSPGGEANGCDELAAAIYAARGKKPITAFVSGMAASGGYWIASAADRVVISEAAMLGSIGVVLGIQDKTAADERRGVKTVEFVSSQSPGKRPDPNTDAGRARIQGMVDDLAGVFIAAVARHRGVSSETVVKNFGAGGIKVGRNAVAAGMADEVGQFETLLQSMARGRKKGPAAFPSTRNMTMNDFSTTAAVAGARETERIRAILESDAGKATPAFAKFLALETGVGVADALKVMAAVRDGIAGEPAHTGGASGASEAASDAGWARATADANRQFESFGPAAGAGHRSSAVDDGWGSATAAANRGIGAN